MQELIVGAIVIVAFGAVLKRYLPKAWRRALGGMAARGARACGWTRLAVRLETAGAAAAGCGDGCGSCGGCDSGAASGAAESTVAVSSIKRASR